MPQPRRKASPLADAMGGDSPKPKPRSGGSEAKVAEPPKPGRAPASNTLEGKLLAMFNSIGDLTMLADPFDGQVIKKNAPILAKSYADLAKENATVKRILEGIFEGSVYGAAIMATAGVALPIMAHHDLWPKGIPNPFMVQVSPEVAAEAARRAATPQDTTAPPSQAPPPDGSDGTGDDTSA